MSFWHTFIGEALHHTFGVGPGGHGAGGNGGSSSADVPLQCYTDLDYYAKHISQCIPGAGAGTTIGVTDPIINPTPTSSVPEPSGLAMVLCGVVLIALFKRCLRK